METAFFVVTNQRIIAAFFGFEGKIFSHKELEAIFTATKNLLSNFMLERFSGTSNAAKTTRNPSYVRRNIENSRETLNQLKLVIAQSGKIKFVHSQLVFMFVHCLLC
jgi:hypothetical protein